ncbi:MAG: hypothetical protein PF572_04170 [Patescibacteria group bacterium]|jgi:transposase|nr:hypothetical protein [Patescibacteria group bacterium]
MKKGLIIDRVISDRVKGFSYKEISDKYGISKSTASLWLKDVKLSNDGEERISFLSESGRKKAANTNKEKAKNRFLKVVENCKTLTINPRKENEDLKIYLALLYWGEGAKTGRRMMFINSDSEMIKTFLYLLRKSYPVDEDKFRAVLHLHDYHDQNKMIKYWSSLTAISKEKISIYRKSNTGKQKKDNYQGCISIRYGDVKIMDEIFIIIDRFKKIYK